MQRSTGGVQSWSALSKEVTQDEALEIQRKCGEQANRNLEAVGRGIAASQDEILDGPVASSIPSNREPDIVKKVRLRQWSKPNSSRS
jgi:hypothetical protein